MIEAEALKYLACPSCKGDLLVEEDHLLCQKCLEKYPLIGERIIDLLPKNFPPDVKLSQEKWERLYQQTLQNRSYSQEKENYDQQYLTLTLEQIFADYRFQAGDAYLEIGCGPMYLGQELAKRGALVIGIDFSPSALVIAAKMLEENGLTKYLLIRGTIESLPLKDCSINFLYGGGVIEHFKNTRSIIGEMHRVLKNGGWGFNTVPHLNLSALTYRQLWGNIPDFPLLKWLAEIIHVKLLQGRFMKFGYELSFTKRKMSRLFSQAGFRRVELKNFRCFLPFEYLRSERLKRIARKISQTEWFDPMLLICSQK